MSNSPQTAPANPVVLETRDAKGIATLVMNRPERLNALNSELAASLNEAMGRIAQDASVRAVVITGAGRAFCAGGDLEFLRRGHESGNAKQLESLLRSGVQMILTMRTMAQPVIAAVNGAAAGGGMNLALAADIRIAADDARFAQSFVKIGLFPDYGGTYSLPELVGPAKAAEMFYTGDLIDAQEALRMGIVNHVVLAAHLQTEAKAMATKIAQGPPIAIKAVKRTVFGEARRVLEEALENEVQQQMKCFASADCGEGLRAFFEKRPPKFEGR